MIYTATITREGGNWLATVTNLDGVSTWAQSFTQLDTYVREAIALAEDLPDGAEESLFIEWTLTDASPEVAEALKVAQLRKRLVREQSSLEPKVLDAVTTLSKAHWSTRDQADLFGMSAGRISQIARAQEVKHA